ncbi:hypothetical protein AGMMS50218_03600 [Actinomycetota bacterium]|nr:hypothetical protein AGMMS50218_03600 [Actinomycetota bacterium]
MADGYRDPVTPAAQSPAAAPPAVTAARTLVQALAALGVRDVVLAPGSRSAPLAYALADADLPADRRPAGAPAVRLHVRVDERSAAFLALGLAKVGAATGDLHPVAVVTTSGTAAANLHPAVLEASHSGLPLLLLTADRPHELRGTGANQTTDQVRLFGTAVRMSADVPAPTGRPGEDRDLRHLLSRAVAAALGSRTGDPGPVHLDLAYREPLVPAGQPWPAPSSVGLVRLPVAVPVAVPAAVPVAVPVDGSGTAVPGSAHGGPEPRGGESWGGVSWGAEVQDPGVQPDESLPGQLPDEPLTVVVAGDGAGDVARRVAEARGWPLLAEPSSGARSGPAAIGAYRLLLDLPAFGGRVRRTVVLGRPTLSRPVSALLARDDVEVVVIAPHGADWPDAGRNATQVHRSVPAWMLAPIPTSAPTPTPTPTPTSTPTSMTRPDVAPGRVSGTDAGSESGTGSGTESGPVSDVSSGAVPGVDIDDPRGWLGAWQAAGAAALAAVDEVLDADQAGPPSRGNPPLSGPLLAREVARATVGTDVLLVGSSSAVRDLDLVARWDRTPLVLANRGLAGIDGTLSTAGGVALGLPTRRVRALVGDLTFLHDVGGLLRGPAEPGVDLQVVVANDDGGAIFAGLEHGSPEHAEVFERIFGTPHGADLAALCAGYGVRHVRVSGTEALAAALAAPGPGTSVVEVRVDRAGRRDQAERIAAAVRRAIG